MVNTDQEVPGREDLCEVARRPWVPLPRPHSGVWRRVLYSHGMGAQAICLDIRRRLVPLDGHSEFTYTADLRGPGQRLPFSC